MDFFGLDIGSSSIKILQLKKEKDQLVLVNIGETVSPQPGVSGETEEQWAQTAEAIKKLISDLKLRTKNAVVGLPEHEVISRLKWFPPMKENEIMVALEFEAETFIPHSLDKVQIDYEIVDKDGKGRLLVFIVAALKTVVQKYLRVAKLAGVVPFALETPAVSLARAFSVKNTATLILDLAAKYTHLIASREGNVFLTRTIPVGAEAFVRSVSVSLGLETNVAVGYFRAYGLKEDELEGKVRKSLMPIFIKLVDEIKKTIYSFREEWGQEIGVLVLSGGGALAPEFIEELVKTLAIEVQIIQPFANVKVNISPPIDIRKEGARFGTVFGLASRGLI